MNFRGQRQRVAIGARRHHPSFLADEPTERSNGHSTKYDLLKGFTKKQHIISHARTRPRRARTA